MIEALGFLNTKMVPAFHVFSGLFEVKQEEVKDEGASMDRQDLSSYLPCEKVLSYGCCIPFLSDACGIVRVIYGLAVVSLGACEIINKIAKAKFKEEASFFEKVVVLKGGSVPLVLKGCEHIILGLTAQLSLMGNVSCAIYELVARPNLPASMSRAVTVDISSVHDLLERMKKHSAIKKVEGFFREFKQLVFNA
jgi:hypothetical protein